MLPAERIEIHHRSRAATKKGVDAAHPVGGRAATFLSAYTHDLTREDLGKLFTRETPEAYQFFARGINTAELEGLPPHRKALKYLQGFFLAFTMRLSPARRVIYAVALVVCVVGLLQLFRGIGMVRVPVPIAFFFVRLGFPGPVFADGTMWLLLGFLLMNPHNHKREFRFRATLYAGDGGAGRIELVRA